MGSWIQTSDARLAMNNFRVDFLCSAVMLESAQEIFHTAWSSMKYLSINTPFIKLMWCIARKTVHLDMCGQHRSVKPAIWSQIWALLCLLISQWNLILPTSRQYSSQIWLSGWAGWSGVTLSAYVSTPFFVDASHLMTLHDFHESPADISSYHWLHSTQTFDKAWKVSWIHLQTVRLLIQLIWCHNVCIQHKTSFTQDVAHRSVCAYAVFNLTGMKIVLFRKQNTCRIYFCCGCRQTFDLHALGCI